MLEAFKKRLLEVFGLSETNDTVRRKRCLDSDDNTSGPQCAKQRKIENTFMKFSSYDFLVPFSTNSSNNKMNISHTPKTFYNSSKRLDLFKKPQSKENIAMESKLEKEKVSDNLHISSPVMKLKLKYKENKPSSYNSQTDKDDVQIIREMAWDKKKVISVPAEGMKSPKGNKRYIPSLGDDFSIVNKLQPMPEAKPSPFPVQTKIPRSRSALDETVRLDEKRKYLELLQHCMVTGKKFLRQYEASTNEKRTKPPKVPVVEEIDLTEKSEDTDIHVISEVKQREKLSSTGSEDDVEVISVIKPPPGEKVQKVARQSIFDLDWITDLSESYDFMKRERQRRIEEKEARAALYRGVNKKLHEDLLEERIKNRMKIVDLSYDDVILYDDELQLPKLTPAMESMVSAAFRPDPRSEVLVEAFSLRITRYDIQSLAGTNWLNDEVINFYMNLLIERGKNDNYPSVYAFNTFFYPKLASSGYSSLKRWTRKVDVFAHDVLIVPVHLGMHWCMAAIDFRNKSICYYDSLGAPNNQCLTLLMKYLESESVDKKKMPFNSEGWYLENAKNIPQQMNGSDCGMFSCTYAEFICRNAKFTFSQKEMPYFRRKMVYEILSKKLLI